MIRYNQAGSLTIIRIDHESGNVGEWIEIAVSDYGVITFRCYSDGGYLGAEKQITGKELEVFLSVVNRAGAVSPDGSANKLES
jgi:hypothetical protein